MIFRLTTLMFFLIGLSSIARTQQKLVLVNPLSISRKDEMIVIKREEVHGILTKIRPFLRIEKKGKPLDVQFDDLNGDGQWDEAICLQSFRNNEKIILSLASDIGAINTIPPRAHVRQKRKKIDDSFGPNLATDSIAANTPNTDFTKVKLPPFLTEGPAWENDKVGFRLYFDIRNGKDIWGKTTSKMMMDTVGVNPAMIYHNLSDWGMDIYKVGSSLSAGALAIRMKLPTGKDSLIRLGGKNMGKILYRRISDGPLRAKFQLCYPVWNYAPGYSPISVIEEITIWGGQFFYNSEVKIEGATKDISLVTGFANLYSIPAFPLAANNGLYSYGKQSENGDNLGLAIMLHSDDLGFTGKSELGEKDIKDSYLVNFKESKAGRYSFRFYSCWSRSDPNFSNIEDFRAFLCDQSSSYLHPIEYSWK